MRLVFLSGKRAAVLIQCQRRVKHLPRDRSGWRQTFVDVCVRQRMTDNLSKQGQRCGRRQCFPNPEDNLTNFLRQDLHCDQGPGLRTALIPLHTVLINRSIWVHLLPFFSSFKLQSLQVIPQVLTTPNPYRMIEVQLTERTSHAVQDPSWESNYMAHSRGWMRPCWRIDPIVLVASRTRCTFLNYLHISPQTPLGWLWLADLLLDNLESA